MNAARRAWFGVGLAWLALTGLGCNCATLEELDPVKTSKDSGPTADAGRDAGLAEDAGLAGDAGRAPDGGQLQRTACPIVNGIDGVGVCGAWQLSSWDPVCTDGYIRVRTCDAGTDCRVTDHNGCSAELSPGAGTVPGCGACGGQPASTLKYFGYWRDSDLQNLVCQVQDHVNFSMTSDSQLIVDRAASYGVANWGFTVPDGGTPAPLGAIVLRDDADASAYGWCSTHSCPNGIADGWAAVKAQAETEGDSTRAMHPNAHLMINLADGDANGKLDFQTIPGFTLPRGVDWVGLECYTGAANCKANMDVLRPLLPANGRVWVITAGTSGFGTEAWLVADAQAMYDWTRKDPAVIGLLAFVWSKSLLCPPDCSTLAVKEMPLLLAKYREIGDKITGRGNVAPKLDSECPPP